MGQITKRVNGFSKLLLSYLLILLIPVVIGAYVHYETLHAVEEEAKRTGIAMLEQSSKIVDEQLNFILGITNRLGANKDVLRFSNVTLPLTDQNYYELMEISRELASHQYLNVYVKDILLYFQKSDTILTTRGVYHGEEEYEQFFRYGEWSYEAWSAMMTQPGHTFHKPEVVRGLSGSYETVAFSAPINLSTGRQTSGAIVVYIDEAKIRELLLPLTRSTGGWAFAVNTESALMIATDTVGLPLIEAALTSDRRDGYIALDGERFFVTSAVSEYSRWEYFSIIPEGVFLQRLLYIRQTIWWITGLSLLAGALAALYLSYRNRRPIARLLREVAASGRSQRRKEEDEYEYILNTYKNVYNSHNDLKKIMDQQLPVLQTVFMEKAMRGEFKSEEEARTFAERAKLPLAGERFLWVVVRIGNYDGSITDAILQELEFNKFVLKNLANDLIRTACAHDLSEDAVAFLVHEPAEAAEREAKLESKLEKLCDFVTERFRMHVKMAAGSSQPRLADSWKSYYEALGALDFAEPNRLTWSELLELTNEYYYPLEIESKLVQTVKAGEESALESLLTHIFDGNFRQRKLSVESKQHLILEMKGTAYKLAGHLRHNEAEAKAAFERSMDRLAADDAVSSFEALSDTFRELQAHHKQQRKDQGHEHIHYMMAYVERHFDDANLSLSTLSTHFSLTENYISFLFKDRTRNNFSFYLEHLRMEKACELLTTTDLSIQDIAAKVGYTNDKSFRRAFKRVKGLQPTAYRDRGDANRELAT